jgi:adenylylsulfate kinase
MISAESFKRRSHSLMELTGMLSVRRKVQDWLRSEVVDDSPNDERFFPTLKPPIESKGLILWLTGLSSSGKTTVAKGVERELRERSCLVELLDGDVVRTNLSKGLGFSREDREINIRRLGFVANLLSRNGVVAIVAAISPYQAARDQVRKTTENFIEVYINAPLEVCEKRDIKGLYAMARAGEIKAFTGIDDPYEEPLNPDIVCYTSEESVEASIAKVVAELERLEYIPAKPQIEYFI